MRPKVANMEHHVGSAIVIQKIPGTVEASDDKQEERDLHRILDERHVQERQL